MTHPPYVSVPGVWSEWLSYSFPYSGTVRAGELENSQSLTLESEECGQVTG